VSGDDVLVRAAVASYHALIVLYPRAFREAYARSMTQAFRDRCRAARREQSRSHFLRLWITATVDLIASAAAMWFGSGTGIGAGYRGALTTVPAAMAFLPDLRVGARTLAKQPGFTLVVVLTLALGIGATTTIFSVVHGVLLRPLPYRDSDQVVTLWQWSQAKGIDEAATPANFLDWRAASRQLQIAAAEPFGMDLTNRGDPVALDTWRVSEGFFETLGVTPVLGRTFAKEEHQPGRDRVVILSHQLWQTRFGSDPAIVGRTVTLDGQPHEVVGVLPSQVAYPTRKDLWTPKVFGERDRRMRNATYYRVVGRLKAGVTIARARAELAIIADNLARTYPRTNKGVGITVQPLFEHVAGPVRPALLLLLAGVGCLLLIACANAANLMLTRAAARRAETAVRTALGAGRWHLLRLALAESTLLAFPACGFGVAASYWAVAAIVALAPPDVPRLDEVGLDIRALLFAVGVAAATAVICGLVPATQLWNAGADRTIRAHGRTGRTRFGSTLVIAQTSLAVMLLVASGLLIRSFGALLKVDLGYRVDNRAALTLHVWDAYRQPERRAWFIDEAAARMRQQPGVVAVGAASALPLSHEGSEMDPPYTVVGEPAPAPGDEPTALTTFVTPGYFDAVGMRLMHGRLLNDLDTATAPSVIVVNETMARRSWPGESPIGRRIVSSLSFAGRGTREIVGVVGDVHQTGLQDRPQPAYYIPVRQVPFGSVTFVVRTSGDPALAVPALQRAVWSINPVLSFAGVETMNGLLRETLAARRFTLTLLSSFSAVALVLAAIGLYGLVSFTVGQRTNEIGIRMALGAGAGTVLAMVMRQGMVVAAAGVAGGLIASAALMRYLTAMLFGVTASDPATFVTLAAVMAIVSALACYVPARRAARVDPLTAIRAD
jgi:putative ABC transport system permease protein